MLKNICLATLSIAAVNGVQVHQYKASIPACNSADFPKCLNAETAAEHKLQADMDKHPKDYFVPNFGVDHDIITTQRNYQNAGGKLAQKASSS
jgi:hypothetical protein